MIRYAGQSELFPGAVEHGGLLVTSGVVAPDVLGGTPLPFDREVAGALDELGALLERAGRGLADVLRVEAYLADASDAPAWNDAFVRHWPDAARRPARTTLTVAFALPAVRFEIQALVAA